MMTELEKYYNKFNEEKRLGSRHGQVEFTTSMKYIHEYLPEDKSAKILDESKIIYIYGMSIGATDALWWERICQWLNGNSSRHLIVYRHSMPAMGLLAVDYKVEERKAKREITGFAKLRDEQKLDIEERIHSTGEIMFAALKDAA